MKFLGFEFKRVAKALTESQVSLVTTGNGAFSGSVVGPSGGGWWGIVRESFAGAWQRNISIDATEGILAFSAVFSCIDLIAADVSKLRPRLMSRDSSGVWVESFDKRFSPLLESPNSYQSRIQFFSQWIVQKLIHGNALILKERDSRNVVIGLHVLNWRLCKVLVTDAGDVYYQISDHKLAGVQSITVPATEVIHDRGICLFHPLVGIPPIYACAMSASQGNRIQNNSAKFFENMSRPSGQLTAPETISDETANRLKADFEANFSGANVGRLLVAGDGLKYEPMTIPAQQAQLIEQLGWTVADVARCFHVPLHKIASDSGVKYANMSEMNQDYYSQTLSVLVENIEVLLDRGLGLIPEDRMQQLGIELDTDVLLRMDPVQRSTRNSNAVKAGYMSPDEARATDGYLPVVGGGGKEPFMQQQQFPLSVLIQQPAPGANDSAAKEAQLARALEALIAASRAMERRTAEVLQ